MKVNVCLWIHNGVNVCGKELSGAHIEPIVVHGRSKIGKMYEFMCV